LMDVLDALSVYTHGPILHSYGNHCLYNLDRPTLQQRLGIPFRQEPNEYGKDAVPNKATTTVESPLEATKEEWVGYYTHKIQTMRLVFLDGYDIAMMQRCPQTSWKYQQAVTILQQNNPHNFAEGNWNSPDGLHGLQRRFVAFNGAIGPTQLQWFRETLQTARQEQETVIVLSHNPIHPESSNPICLLWNYEQVLDILREYSDVVVACLAGHAHRGGYVRDSISGIHFRVFEAALENRPEKTYAIIHVHCHQHNDDDGDSEEEEEEVVRSGKLIVQGFGNCESAVYDFDHTMHGTKKATTNTTTPTTIAIWN
jgi:manganese-dependent ADP-ribose/CDP-alcohol diphosphatase